MILTIAQATTCFGVFAVAVAVFKGSRRAPSLLLPLIIVSSVLGIALLYPYATEIFVANYSGAIYEMEALTYRLNGPYWWVYYGSALLPLLPILALVPPVRKLPLLVAILALLAAVPAAFWTFQELAFG